MDRRKTREVLFAVFECAKQDRRSFIDAYGNDDSEIVVREARKDITAFERLQDKIFGTTRTKMDTIIDGMKKVSLADIQKLVETKPELFDIVEETT